jgi:hypothetical protein
MVRRHSPSERSHALPGGASMPAFVHQDVKPTVCIQGQRDYRLGVLRTADVHPHGDRLPTRRLDLANSGGRVLDISDDHASTGLGEGEGDRPADPLGPSRDDGCLSAQRFRIAHIDFLLIGRSPGGARPRRWRLTLCG